MNFFRRLFGKRDEPVPEEQQKGRPYGSSDREIEEFFLALGHAVIGDEEIIFTGYPFKPSVAFGYKVIEHSQITSIDLDAAPPSLLVGGELIFISAGQREQLKIFAEDNDIKIESRPDIWGWILQPFLDTEFTAEQEQRINALLAGYGLNATKVNLIRNEVGEQMYKYNFDTLLWDWTGLGILDLLMAMKPKYDEERFRAFYKEVMKIALLPPVNEENK